VKKLSRQINDQDSRPMFQAFDSDPGDAAFSRAQWMALLARSPLPLLEQVVGEAASGGLQWLRRPQAGLMMVQGRAGGTGERFNLGEVTVTRCALRLIQAQVPAGHAGVAWILGRDQRQCTLAAVADALLQDPAQHAGLVQQLLIPTRQHIAAAQRERAELAQATRVDFFTVAREAGTETEASA
jgi:alpha-D-ribose 1-methylphosphonate 5-triphosphate synthase subunit PhnG